MRGPFPHCRGASLLAALLGCLLLVSAPALPRDATTSGEGAADPAPRFQEWLRRVAFFITEEERQFFLELEEDYRREAFTERFWEVRDPDPSTPYNELEGRWERRVDQVLEDYGHLRDARAQVLILNGEPGPLRLADGRVVDRCFHKSRELEIWFYPGTLEVSEPFALVLFQPAFPPGSDYRVWKADQALTAETRRQLPTTSIRQLCAEELLGPVTARIREDHVHYLKILDAVASPPRPNSKEWLHTFASLGTEVPEEAATFPLELQIAFPGRHQHRTAVQGVVKIPPGTAASVEVDGTPTHHFLLTGEVIRDGSLFESFRYRFEVPRGEGAAPLVFQRYLRPGEVEVRLKVEDVYGNQFAHVRRQVEVPAVEARLAAPEMDSDILRLLAEANEAAERGQQSIRIVPPAENRIHVGLKRFQTVATGDFERVAFYLDEQEVMSKTRPPYSVELDLGDAATHVLRVAAFDEENRVVASDELVVNQGGQRFRVRFAEPRPDRRYEESLSAVVRAEVPDGKTLDRIELFRGEERMAVLYQEPFVQPILLPDEGLTFLRAVGYLEDNSSAEDVVFVNAPPHFERIEVQLVELYAAVLDRQGRPVEGLDREDFTVFEDGREQELQRFARVDDLPIHAGLLIDTSASMEEHLDQVATAAERFVEETIGPRDRVALISFDVRPEVRVRFTSEDGAVEQALLGLRALGSTALYDSLVYALHYFDGMKGQKALLLLSDGRDEASRFDAETVLVAAQRAGVSVYAIGLAGVTEDRDARRVLRRLAEETGGRSFFLRSPDELPGVYQEIQRDLRSQYLLAYQSTSTRDEGELRRIRVEVDEPGARVRTMAGYYP